MFYFYLFIAIVIIMFALSYAFRNSKAVLNRNLERAKENGNVRYVAWNGKYSWDAVGESFYQLQLSLIAGAKEAEAKSYDCHAALVRDPHNKYDANAVMILIEGRHVGHISKARAASFAQEMRRLKLSNDTMFIVKARINGGWKDPYSEGNYGVVFDFPPINRMSTVLSDKSMEDSEILFKNRLKKN